MKKTVLIFISIIFFLTQIFSQNTSFYPTNWWVGMKWNKVQILVYNKAASLKNATVQINYPGILLTKINRLEN